MSIDNPINEKQVLHTQLKFKCTICGLHFIVCTWQPERHGVMAEYCPECGQHEGRFVLWSEPSDLHIFEVVPGQSQMIDLKL